jgi:hypothetical protein
MGASGTGKTTLARAVSRQLSLPIEQWFIDPYGTVSTTRKVAIELVGSPEPYLVDGCGKRAAFQRRLQAAKYDWENTHTTYVTDRTHYDNLAYSWLHDSSDTAMCSDFRQKTYEYSKNYTHIFWCPIDEFHHTGTDQARKTDLLYHKIYEDILLTLTHHYNVEIEVVFGKTAEERLEWVLDCLKPLDEPNTEAA